MFGFDKICKPFATFFSKQLNRVGSVSFTNRMLSVEAVFFACVGFLAYKRYKYRLLNSSLEIENDPVLFVFGCKSPGDGDAIAYGFTINKKCIKKRFKNRDLQSTLVGGMIAEMIAEGERLDIFIKTYNSFVSIGWTPMTQEELTPYFNTTETTIFGVPDYEDVLYNPHLYDRNCRPTLFSFLKFC